MNSTLTFTDLVTFNKALNVLALESSPSYSAVQETLTIDSQDVIAVAGLLYNNGLVAADFTIEAFGVDVEDDMQDDLVTDREGDQFMHDGEADGDALASAGYGTDEDYGSASEHFSDDE